MIESTSFTGQPSDRVLQSAPPQRRRPLTRLVVAALLAAIVWTQIPLAARAQSPAVPQVDQSEPSVPRIPARNLLQIVKAGGILMFPILFCSVLMMVFVFERAIALRTGRVIPKPFVKRFLHQIQEGKLDKQQALELCAESKSAVAAMFAGGCRKWGRPEAEVEQAIMDAGERAVNGLRRYIRAFNAVATICPLLGLLGTVYGMITAFNEIAHSDAMGRPEQLAGGIGEALLATAFGLTVAIPSLAFYMYFISRVDRLVIELDAVGQELVQLISAEAQQEAAPRPSRRREAA